MMPRSTAPTCRLSAATATVLMACLLSADAGQAALPRDPQPSPAPSPSTTASSPAPTPGSEKPAAEPRHLQEATADWLGVNPAGVVENNQIVQINLKINANSSDGSNRELPTKETIVLTNGVFDASASTVPGVTVSPDRRTATVDFGAVPGGTARQLALDVQVRGEDGEKLTAVVTPNLAPPITLKALTIRAVHAATFHVTGGGTHFAMPKDTKLESADLFVRLTIPRNGAPIGPEADFEFGIDGTERDEFRLLRVLSEPDSIMVQSRPGGYGPAGAPTVKVTKDEQKGVFRARVTGLSHPDASLAGPGKDLTVLNVRIRMKYDNAGRAASRVNEPYDFTAMVKNPRVTTASGRPISVTLPDGAKARFQGRFSIGTVQFQRLHGSLPELIPDSKNIALHRVPGSDWLRAQPGDQTVLMATSGVNRHITPKTADQFHPVKMYLPLDPGYTRFTGSKIGLQVSGGPIVYYDRKNLPGFIKWTTDPITSHADDLSRLRYTSGGSMPDNATVVAFFNDASVYREAKNGAPDSIQRRDNLFVPVEFIGDRLTRDFDGKVITAVGRQISTTPAHQPSAMPYEAPREAPASALLDAPVKRFPKIVGRTEGLDVITLSPFAMTTTIAAGAPKLNVNETTKITFTSRVSVKHPDMAPDRQRDHSVTATAVIPATLEVQQNSLPEGVTATVQPDGTTTIAYEATAKANEDIVRTVTVKARVNGSTARITHRVENVSSFINRALDTTRASRVFELPLTGANETQLGKKPFADEMAFNGRNAWVITETNRSAHQADRLAVVDILPFAGDEHGSAFRGSIAYREKVTAPEGTRVFYTSADPKTLHKDPADPSNAGGGLDTPGPGWSESIPAQGYTAVLLLATKQAPGSALSFEVPFSVSGNLPGDVFKNTAWARSGTGGSNTDLRMIRSAQSVSPKEESRLQVSKKVAEKSESALPGGTVTFTVTARNSGTTPAPGVVVRDFGGQGIDPASIVFTRLPEGTSSTGGTWNVGTLAPGQSLEATVTAKTTAASAGTEAVNRVRISNENNPEPEDPSATCTPNVDAASDTDACDEATVRIPTGENVKIDKTAIRPRDAAKQGAVAFTVTVKNAGETPAKNVVVTDWGGLNLDPATITFHDVPEGTKSSGSTWTIPELGAGESRTVTVEGKVSAERKPGEKVENRVTVTTQERPGPRTGEDSGPHGDKDKSAQGESCQVNATVDEDTDGCDIETVTPEHPAPSPSDSPSPAPSPSSPETPVPAGESPAPPRDSAAPDSEARDTEPKPQLLSTGNAGLLSGPTAGAVGAAAGIAVIVLMAGAVAALRLTGRRDDS